LRLREWTGERNSISTDSAATVEEALQPKSHSEGSRKYADWVRLYDTIDDDDRRAIVSAMGEMNGRPLISVVMPVYNTPEPYLRAAIESVGKQLYPHWELCIADDASTTPYVRVVLEHYRAMDPRIRICYHNETGYISAASNSALALATGSFVALLDHDDVLPEHALYMVAATLNSDREVDLIYSDEDKIDENGQRFGPHFKSDWNPDLMLSQNMFCHLGVYRRSLIEKIGGFRCGYEGSQNYDLVLRAQRLSTPKRIRHIPHVLYHCRAIPGTAVPRSEEKPHAGERALRAIADHLAESGLTADVLASSCPMFHRVRYALPQQPPRVTIIVPTRDRVDLLRACVDGLLHRTDYPDLEILIINNQSREAVSHAYFDELSQDARIKILSYDAPFNYSAINNFAVARGTGSVLCLLNSDTEVIRPDWLTEMVSHAIRDGVGAVGAMLYYPNDTIQHGGIVLGLGGIAGHIPHGAPRGDLGYHGRATVVQNLSAVTAACLVMQKIVFDKIGGFNERDLAITYSDVDLCLRIREAGYRIVWTPHAELYHHESVSRGIDTDPDNIERFKSEVAYMLRRWGNILDRDPYYNPNLRLDGRAFDLAFPPRVKKPWQCGTGGKLPSHPEYLQSVGRRYVSELSKNSKRESAMSNTKTLTPNRHESTFLTLSQTSVDLRFEMPYLRTFDFPDKFINQQHRRLASNIGANGMIDIGIEGWLLPADALKLYELAYFCGGDVLELGTYRGLSASISAQASQAAGLNNVIVSIDLDRDETERARSNLAGKPGFEKVHLFTVEAGQAVRDLAHSKRMFDFAFIDHSHTYEHVYDVCRSLHRITKLGAFALFHDFNDPRNSAPDATEYGVYQGVLDGLDQRRFEFWGIYGCSGLFRRVGSF
jgi:GT2 family glycosyltransferase/cephalosporin hydroxylase